MQFKQLQMNYMQELMFRLNDYFFYQFIYAFTDVYPYEEIYQRLKSDVDPFDKKKIRKSAEKKKTKNKSLFAAAQRASSMEGQLIAEDSEEQREDLDSRSSSFEEQSLAASKKSNSLINDSLGAQGSKRKPKVKEAKYDTSEESSRSSLVNDRNEEDANADIPDEEEYNAAEESLINLQNQIQAE